MKNIPASLILEKNKLATSSAWLLLIDVTLPDSGPSFNLVRNNEDISWNGTLYSAFPFELDLPDENSKGEIPMATLMISNVTRALLPYLHQYGGGVGSTVVLHIVNSGHIAENASDLDLTFEVMSTEDDTQWINFKLGAPNPLRSTFPKYRYLAAHCRWTFKGAECAYAGGLTTCGRTLDDCRTRANSTRFGGEPGLDAGGIRIV
ncbi:MAG: DUF1833 family protein [Nitrospirae bacterium]|nr:DUF1833 family protein [Nitrospirota bacterium]